MNLQTFFEKFELFADVPDAVGKMRELVLELAVQGRLAPQDSRDEPASAMLERVSSSAKTRRREIGESDQIEAPFRIPTNWAWVRLPRVLHKLTDGTHHSPANGPSGDFMYVTAKNIKTDGVLLDGITYVTKEVHHEIYSRCDPSFGDVLYIKDGATTGIATINQVKEPFSMLSSVALLKPSDAIVNRYLLWTMRSPFFYAETRGAMKGAAITRVTLSVMAASLLPLPPLAEQKRIVAKVDELMVLCDRLEAQQQERQTRHAALTRASLARFADAPTTTNLNFLFHNSYSTPPVDLRKSILTLAVQGKLVAQDPNDEGVEELLIRNDARRHETAQSDHRADEEDQPLLSADDRWDIADTWSWRGLADLVLFVDYRGKTPVKLSSGVRLLTAKNVRKGQINLSPEEFLSHADYKQWMTRGFPKSGDVLFTTEAPMGNAAVVELAERFALAQRVICFQSYGAMDSAFLVMQILSDQFQLILDKNGTGVTAKGIKASKLKQLPVAIPPLAEQLRIVARVDQLMALVDQLEAQLASSQTLSERLLEAVVHDVLQAGRGTKQSLSVVDRAAIGCYALKRMQSNPSFARTAEVKMLYLAEAHLGLPLGGEYHREAAGPFDKWIYEFERQADKEGWFKTSNEGLTDGRSITRYKLLPAIQSKVDQAIVAIGERREEFDRLLACFKTLTTEEIEIIATLFAAWNDALIDGNKPNDDWIIREVRENWHERKQRFSPERLSSSLSWMRNHKLTPTGKSPRTIHQVKLQLR